MDRDHKQSSQENDPRCRPLIDVSIDRIRVLLSPLLQGLEIRDAKLVAGGLVNTVYRIHPKHTDDSLCLRIFAGGDVSWNTERIALSLVPESLPVPIALLAEQGSDDFPYPYFVYRWIEGVTLDECRKRRPPGAFLSLAAPLGRLLAELARVAFIGAPSGSILTHTPVILSKTEEQLRHGAARLRLGVLMAERILQCLEMNADRLYAVDQQSCLAHGDFGGRNILVASDSDGGWRVSGLIDWEESFWGSPLWDIGRLFRYANRYSENFIERFESAYYAAGGKLPDDWRRISRLLDATNLIEILSEEPELPVVFAECRQLVEGVIADWA